ncbi:MAG TPA: malto-oligosyltrehalose synthase [Acetobacteraceae bacterium]|nr:malto-oligosyltrehalose synthase [Acetobacteraceae bacterium]
MSVPRATMRLQLHHDFTFVDATRLVPYAAQLGISHFYVSPILTARPGSTHGYDVTDPTRVNPQLGGEDGLRDMIAAMRQVGMGLIVDIVPNHMEAGGLENPWWGDVLRLGTGSRYAKFFDIDWNPREPALHGKVLAPFLGEPYGEALRSGSISLTRQRGEPVIRYYDTLFPIRPEDHAEIAAAELDAYDPVTETGRARLHRLLERQHYRLAWWRCAGDEINWRRFFDINSLAGVRIEEDEVFDATHGTLLRLYRQGLIDGVRVDHVDGLADPPGYCRRLRARLGAQDEQRPATAPRGQAWLVVEKILGAGEHLPTDWQVDGTSGYDFMDLVNALLHDPAGAAPLRELWASISGRPADFAIEDIAARHDVLDRAFTAQLDAAASALHGIARTYTETRDTTFASIRRALVALLSHFPVYRGYGCERSPQEAGFFAKAVEGAMRECRAADHPVVLLIDRLLGDPANETACIRFQQLSAPLVAKAVEDTAFYRYGVLLSRNEVGADIARFSLTPREFHAACEERREHFPDAMLATATHDHKRGEDVRARLAVLSEAPEEWAVAVTRWLELNAAHRRYDGQPMPSPGDELMLYQMIVGAWPVQLAATDVEGLREFAERLAGWQLKAMREAKLATDWNEPNLDYEDAARSFLYTIMSEHSAFLAEAANFAHRIGPAGAIKGLAQTVLKLTAPGVPDLYQGTEFWDQSLVDPDNRRPVDFALRLEALADDRPLMALAQTWRDGRVKQALIRRALDVRRAQPDLFARGSYESLQVTGPLADHIVAFARSLGDSHVIVVVPRLASRLLAGGDAIVLRQDVCNGTEVHLPRALHSLPYRAVTGGDAPAPSSSPWPLASILRESPVALLVTA